MDILMHIYIYMYVCVYLLNLFSSSLVIYWDYLKLLHYISICILYIQIYIYACVNVYYLMNVI